MGYGNLFTSLAGSFGRGQQRAIEEEEALQAQVKGFRRLQPLREEAARAQATLAEEFAIRGEERKSADQIADELREAEGFRAATEWMMPPTVTPEVPAYTGVSDLLRTAQPGAPPTEIPFQYPKGASKAGMAAVMDIYKAKAGRETVSPTLERDILAQTKHLPPDEAFRERQRLRAEGAGLRLQSTQAAGPTRAERMTFTAQYEGSPGSRAFVIARDAYTRLESIGMMGTPASDIAAIYQFMRGNDPESAVRDPEIRMAERAGSLATSIRNGFMRLKTGQRLTPEQRRDFLTVAGRIFEGNVRNQQDYEAAQRLRAREFGMPETDVTDIIGRYRIKPGSPGSGKIIKEYDSGVVLRKKP